ncbi:hypothetical protein FGB62_203g014 [Gracilaria domingensis]|nr:hypothetical protein FGB62_203g014 [Gracilaria domingensis]
MHPKWEVVISSPTNKEGDVPIVEGCNSPDENLQIDVNSGATMAKAKLQFGEAMPVEDKTSPNKSRKMANSLPGRDKAKCARTEENMARSMKDIAETMARKAEIPEERNAISLFMTTDDLLTSAKDLEGKRAFLRATRKLHMKRILSLLEKKDTKDPVTFEKKDNSVRKRMPPNSNAGSSDKESRQNTNAVCTKRSQNISDSEKLAVAALLQSTEVENGVTNSSVTPRSASPLPRSAPRLSHREPPLRTLRSPRSEARTYEKRVVVNCSHTCSMSAAFRAKCS